MKQKNIIIVCSQGLVFLIVLALIFYCISQITESIGQQRESPKALKCASQDCFVAISQYSFNNTLRNCFDNNYISDHYSDFGVVMYPIEDGCIIIRVNSTYKKENLKVNNE